MVALCLMNVGDYRLSFFGPIGTKLGGILTYNENEN